MSWVNRLKIDIAAASAASAFVSASCLALQWTRPPFFGFFLGEMARKYIEMPPLEFIHTQETRHRHMQ